MLICNPCLEKHYQNDHSWFRSHGMCECCQKAYTDCNDISSKKLMPKETNKKIIKAKPGNVKRSPNYMFVRRVMRSCKNMDQLEMAEKMLWQYATINVNDKSSEDLMKIYCDKKSELTLAK